MYIDLDEGKSRKFCSITIHFQENIINNSDFLYNIGQEITSKGVFFQKGQPICPYSTKKSVEALLILSNLTNFAAINRMFG